VYQIRAPDGVAARTPVGSHDSRLGCDPDGWWGRRAL